MRYVRPRSLDELNNLDSEVTKELDGIETSFTTQRKVYQFLVRDYEEVNVTLQRELLTYRRNINTYRGNINNRLDELTRDVELLRNEMSNVNNENEQLHEVVVFLSNQLNGRQSTNLSSSSSSSSSSSDDASVFLDDIIENLRQNTTESVSASSISSQSDERKKNSEGEHARRDTVNSGNYVPTCQYQTSEDLDLDFAEAVETLTENIELKDQLIEHLKTEIEDQGECIRLLLKQQSTYPQQQHQQPNQQYQQSELSDLRSGNQNEVPVKETVYNENIMNSTLSEPLPTIDRGLMHTLFSSYPTTSINRKECLRYQLTEYRCNEARKCRDRIGSAEYNNLILHDQRIELQETFDEVSSAPLSYSSDRNESSNDWSDNTISFEEHDGENVYINNVHEEQNTNDSAEERSEGNANSNDDLTQLNHLRNHHNYTVHKWPRGTTLITGDSILNNIQEDRIGGRNRPVKVRAFPGATIEDLYDYLTPLLKKEPTNIILHAGSNNSTSEDAQTIIDKLLLLRRHIQAIVPNTGVYLSTPVLRMDNPRAGFVLRQVSDRLMTLNINCVDNDGIDASCVGQAGLHLNGRGAGKLAINFIKHMKRL